MNKKVHILFLALAYVAYTSAGYVKVEEEVSPRKKFFLICIGNPNFANLIKAYRDKTIKTYKRDLAATHDIRTVDNVDRDAREMRQLNEAISKLHGEIIRESAEGVFKLKVEPPQCKKAVIKSLMKSSYYVSQVVAGKKRRTKYLKDRRASLALLG